jgi:beta-glucanase (GH16 family)
MRAQLARLGVAAALLAAGGAGLIAVGRAGSAEGGPTVSQPAAPVPVVEGDAGEAAVVIPVTLEPAASAPVQVDYETLDNSATAGLDYSATSGTLTFAPGTTTQTITVPVLGDGLLEDHELFRVRLENVVGAELGNHVRKVEIQNDETPVLAASGTRTTEGLIATFKLRLRQRYHEPLVVDAVSRDLTARAPSDYAPKRTAVAFAAGTRGPVEVRVATRADARDEPDETLALNAGAPGMLAAAVATVADGPRVVTPPPTPPPTQVPGGACVTGTVPTAPRPAAPPSPSSPSTFLPPAEVIGTEQWDLLFHDEFDDAASTASKWSTGMRTGDRTLESNGELQWYQPDNSVLTGDHDGLAAVGVLRQTLQREQVPNRRYTVRTLSRLYPPASCPSLYRPNANNSTSVTNTTPSLTPYQFTSGMLNNSKSFGFRYGYVETRVKMPKGFALWPALWLRDWGGWGYEIDALEGFDRHARTFRTGYWWGNGSTYSTENDDGDVGLSAGGVPCRQHLPIPATTASPAECSLANGVDLSAGYHTVGLWWLPDRYVLYLDGVRRWTSPPGADVADTYHHLILNLAFGNNEYEFDWTDHPVRPLDPDLFTSSLFPKRTVEWDYVRVWQAHGSVDVCTPPNCR